MKAEETPGDPAQAAPDTVPSELGQRLPLVMSRLGRSLRHAYAPIGVNLGQFPVLTSLLDRPGATVSELATREKVKLPSMTAVITQMETDGLVVKGPDPEDRRCVRVTLTQHGTDVAQAARAARIAWFATRLNHLSRSEVAAVSRALAALEHLVEIDR
ncbi:MAG TPA: MarR family transcriptional regulator [Candidatus Dormibacteraeota bacterium]|nr:MarR family transcriptional regulator [Candidatus Dormibacteraeota bacterium]